MTDPQPVRIVISPVRKGYTVTSYEGERQSVIAAETLEQARRYAQQLAATANGAYQIIEETRLMWPLYLPDQRERTI